MLGNLKGNATCHALVKFGLGVAGNISPGSDLHVELHNY